MDTYFGEGAEVPDHVYPLVHAPASGYAQGQPQAPASGYAQGQPLAPASGYAPAPASGYAPAQAPAQASGQIHPQAQAQSQLADDSFTAQLLEDLNEICPVEEELGESHVLTAGEQVIEQPAEHDYASQCCAFKFHSDDDTDDETPAMSLIDCQIIFN